MSVGKPIYFDIDIYLSVVEMMISSDEVERAFRMIENVPGYYRHFPTERMKEIRNSLHKQLFTPAQYHKADVETRNCNEEDLSRYRGLGRCDLLAKRIKGINDVGVKPNIMEIGPGSFWLPYVLRGMGLEFSYEYQSLDTRPLPFDQPSVNPGINIFVAYEFIEHLSNEFEIYQSYLKFGKLASYVFLSTPLFTYNGGMPNWRNNPLGHLRTYTPNEFHAIASRMFEGYEWECFTDDTIVLQGIRKCDHM